MAGSVKLLKFRLSPFRVNCHENSADLYTTLSSVTIAPFSNVRIPSSRPAPSPLMVIRSLAVFAMAPRLLPLNSLARPWNRKPWRHRLNRLLGHLTGLSSKAGITAIPPIAVTAATIAVTVATIEVTVDITDRTIRGRGECLILRNNPSHRLWSSAD